MSKGGHDIFALVINFKELMVAKAHYSWPF